MAQNEFSISAKATRWIKSQGYTPHRDMDEHIADWRNWYTCGDNFYKVHYITTEGNKRSRERCSIHPARKVCREMASLILTEDTEVSVEAKLANEWLQEFLAYANFWPTGQLVVEQAFSLGTAAWALQFDTSVPSIQLRRYDARMIVPLTWDDDGVRECAFVTRIMLRGKPAEQVQLMVLIDETYHIVTRYFQGNREINPEDVGDLGDFDTLSPRKPFGIFKPGVDNVYEDLSPFGASIFADAIGAIKAVDAAWDAMVQEIVVTQPRVFIDEAMLDMQTKDGKAVPTGMTDDMLYRKVAGTTAQNYIEVFSPNMRITPIREALDTALAQLGDCCGFGQEYFKLGKNGGLKTATEVVTDNSALMRNIRKHENVIRGAIQDVVSALLDGARNHLGAAIEEDFGAVSVNFDDSVITDTQTEKNMMLAEIAAGVVPKWRYLTDFYGMSKEEARQEVGIQVSDEGY